LDIAANNPPLALLLFISRDFVFAWVGFYGAAEVLAKAGKFQEERW